MPGRPDILVSRHEETTVPIDCEPIDARSRAGIQGRFGSAFDTILLAACVTAIGAFLINQVWDYDVWWHVVIGGDILARRAVPVTDHFAAATLGRPYHDSQWLYQVVLALAHRAGGMVGVQAVMVGVWATTLFFCRRSIMRWATPLAGTLLLFLAAMASIERFDPRPEIITLVMVSIYTWLLQERQYLRLKDLLLFGVLQAVWANAHGLFVIGLFMVGCYWLVAALRRVQGGESDFVPLSRLLGVVTAATLISPYGGGGWRYAFLLLSEVGPGKPTLFRTIGELGPIFGSASRSGLAFWFFAALLVATIITTIPVALRGRISLARLLIVGGLFAVALTGRRSIPPFMLVAAPFVAENLRLLSPQGIRNERLKMVMSLMLSLAMLAAAGYSLSGAYWLNTRTPSRFGLGATPSLYPHDLPQILDRAGFQGQIYNSHGIGGFYLYEGYPQRLPLIDNRFEVYDMAILDKILAAPSDPEAWEWMVSTYGIRGLLLQHVSAEAKALLPKLRSQDTWRLVHFDHAISLWMRNDTPDLPPSIDLTTAALPPKPARLDDCRMLNVFLSMMDAYELKVQNQQRALEFNWDVEKTLTDIGQTQMRLQRFDQAESTYKRLLRDYPRNLSALNDLGVMAYQKGDLATAERMLRRALEIQPDNADFRANYRLLQSEDERR